MSSFKFNSQDNFIICRAEVYGKDRSLAFKMIIDTGSTYTLIPRSALALIGNPKLDNMVEITTGSRVESFPLVIVPTFKALGFAIHHFPVIIHDLPLGSPVDGLLGFNFLKKAKAIIDFSKNKIVI